MTFRRSLCLALLPALLLACDGSFQDGDTADGSSDQDGSTPPVGTLIDDFEDGNEASELGSPWHVYSDADADGASAATGPEGGSWITSSGHDSSHSLALDYTLSQGAYAWDPFVGAGVPIPGSVDAGAFEGISYWFRGPQHTVRFETSNVADYDYYVFAVPAATQWTQVRIAFSQLRQAGYGTVVDWDPSLLTTINWHIVGADGSAGSFALDDAWFEQTVEIDRGPKNLVVHEAAPPTKTELGDIGITNPLQAKAMAQLDRGYNLTNWLESARFESFVYDEAYVDKLAAAGFLSLRLPIDLDLYVASKSGSGATLTVTLDTTIEDILDKFDAWTAKNGMSLTIDYHQYDKSFAFGDTEGEDLAVALWKAVADHFAANPRDDVYFELLNEPELSTGASSILPASAWTPVAQRMIDAIRSVDTDHTIIFGDVNWYGIEQLAVREPFADANIVYAFHSYEPFVFTHQGADWAQMASTHDIPFPYTPERWSEYSSDLGLTAAQPQWIWDAFENYHVAGTPEAMWNRIAVAKAWAVENNVPIICNEFGAFDRTSRLEDRVAYYTDLIDMFAELEIPWQHWFMIMDAEGNVIPEYIEAFHLDQ